MHLAQKSGQLSGKYSVGETTSLLIAIKTDSGTMAWECKGDVVRTERRGAYAGAAVNITNATVKPVSQW